MLVDVSNSLTRSTVCNRIDQVAEKVEAVIDASTFLLSYGKFRLLYDKNAPQGYGKFL